VIGALFKAWRSYLAGQRSGVRLGRNAVALGIGDRPLQEVRREAAHAIKAPARIRWASAAYTRGFEDGFLREFKRNHIAREGREETR